VLTAALLFPGARSGAPPAVDVAAPSV
jgi:hypothetical protein